MFAASRLADQDPEIHRLAAEAGLAPAQFALSWLLDRSPVVLPIPGTSRADHLKENVRTIERG